MQPTEVKTQPDGMPEGIFSRQIVHRVNEKDGTATLTYECGHQTEQIIARSEMELGAKMTCAECVNHLAAHKKLKMLAYRIEVSEAGCRHCGAGREWVIVGMDGCATSITWCDIIPAIDDLDLRNDVFEIGFEAGAKATREAQPDA